MADDDNIGDEVGTGQTNVGRMSNADHAELGHAHMHAAREHRSASHVAPTAGLANEHLHRAGENEKEAGRHFVAAGEPATLHNPLGVDQGEAAAKPWRGTDSGPVTPVLTTKDVISDGDR